MKRLIGFLLALVLAVTAMPAVAAAPPPTGILCSIYDDTEKVYLVENTLLPSEDHPTLFLLFDLLYQQGLIESYVLFGNDLITLVLPDGKTVQTASYPATVRFSVKRNGKLIPAEKRMDLQLQDGDIVEWIYGQPANLLATPDREGSSGEGSPQPPKPSVSWSAQAQQAMRQGADYLNLHQEDSTFYILAMSCAGRTAEAAAVNSLLADIRGTARYETATALAKSILLLTFSGYDAQRSVDALAEFADMDAQGIFGPINSLVAYDCKQYAVSADAANARRSLVDRLLAEQHETGGFGLSEDDVDSTAMALTALSPYRSEERVAKAIDVALDYLASAQGEDGSFGFRGSDTCESLCQVIIALCSLGVLETDTRFVVDGASAVDRLLRFANPDGGFSHLSGGASDVMATEQAVIALSAVKRNECPYQVSQNLVLQQQPSQETFLPVNGPFVWDMVCLAATLLLAAAVIGWAVYRRGKDPVQRPGEE